MLNLILYTLAGSVIYYIFALMAKSYYSRIKRTFEKGGLYYLKAIFYAITGIMAFLMLGYLSFIVLGKILCLTDK